ncbi:type II toxin-antitoxin system ParD family antitoxin [Bosea caraganae]|uniref:Type II toxin-antitoxin system ParD family antitoxin n=1 Tax=Bosea caraganae TaxID=2763117 RepID=A0A370LBB6_9HYPH|nr:type II toxin-antitoxin system ParD family antitoxin [Bosea caraganae]RDJ27122.1 type II toxin-antitoxin system ParD family antitoxin [Bosea caraganae]RDJ29139.1 type II toxin-antitoxin system ParD family antitoxin [Bosea caraganae]
MPSTAKHVITLAPEANAFIEAQLRSSAFETWLRDKVGPAFDAMKADPSRGIPAKTAFDAVRARHAERNRTRDPI